MTFNSSKLTPCSIIINFRASIHLFIYSNKQGVTPNVVGGGSEGQNIQGMEWGSESVEYMTTLCDQIANQLLSNGSR